MNKTVQEETEGDEAWSFPCDAGFTTSAGFTIVALCASCVACVMAANGEWPVLMGSTQINTKYGE